MPLVPAQPRSRCRATRAGGNRYRHLRPGLSGQEQATPHGCTPVLTSNSSTGARGKGNTGNLVFHSRTFRLLRRVRADRAVERPGAAQHRRGAARTGSERGEIGDIYVCAEGGAGYDVKADVRRICADILIQVPDRRNEGRQVLDIEFVRAERTARNVGGPAQAWSDVRR